VHGFQEFPGDGIAGAFANDGIDAAVRALGRATAITGIIGDQPILDLSGVKDPAAVKAAADRILPERFHVIVAVLVCFDMICHKTFPEVTSPKSTESTNSTTPAYSFVPLIFTRRGIRGGAFRLIHDLLKQASLLLDNGLPHQSAHWFAMTV